MLQNLTILSKLVSFFRLLGDKKQEQSAKRQLNRALADYVWGE